MVDRRDPSIVCPHCGSAAALEDLVRKLEEGPAGLHRRMSFAAQNPPHLEHRCRRCHVTYGVPIGQVAGRAIQRQTQELVSSITRLLERRSRLH